MKKTKPAIVNEGPETFRNVWEQLEALRTITEMTGGLHPEQIKYLKVWPRLAILTSTKCECMWNPGDIQDNAKRISEFPIPQPQSVDDVRCQHTFKDGDKVVRMYKSMCTICRPELTWPGKVGGQLAEIRFDLISDKRRKEPEGREKRLQMLGNSVQAMLGKRVKVIVNLNGEQIYVQEPKG